MKNKQYDKEQPRRRFNKKVDGPTVMEWYAKMPTAELAERMGLTVRQITNYVYRHNTEPWARKMPSVLSAENSRNGRCGGRPLKKRRK
jgi:hypothetical protein